MSYGTGCQGVHFFGFYTAQYNKMPEADTFEESLNIKHCFYSSRPEVLSALRCLTGFNLLMLCQKLWPANMKEQQFQISQWFMFFYDQWQHFPFTIRAQRVLKDRGIVASGKSTGVLLWSFQLPDCAACPLQILKGNLFHKHTSYNQLWFNHIGVP